MTDRERIEATIDRMLKNKIIDVDEHVIINDALRLGFDVLISQETGSFDIKITIEKNNLKA